MGRNHPGNRVRSATVSRPRDPPYRGRCAAARAFPIVGVMRPPTTRLDPGRPHRPSGRVRAVALASAVAAIVIGILGMHAIDLHGAHVGGGDQRTDHHAAPAAAAPAAAAVHHRSRSTTADATADAPDAPTDAGGDPGGMVMLCMAMLAGASVLALVLRRLHRDGRAGLPAPLVRWSTVRVGAVAAYLGTGPPPVCRFSVIRC